MRFDDVLDAIGHTPLVRLRGPGEAYAKLELANLFAMKDRVAKQVVLDARRTGALVDGAPIIESSSGTMALGLALVGRALGHEVHIVTDPRIDPITRAKLAALGCVLHVVDAMTSQGWQSARLERLAELMSTLDGAFWPRQYSNPQNPAAYAALAAELKADLGQVDVLVGPVGSGGSLCGTARALKRDLPGLRVVAVDAVGSVLFGQPDRPGRRQSGLGNSLHPENLDHSLVDEVHWLSDDEAFAATHALAREQQLFGGNTSGSVYQIVRHLAGTLPEGTRIVGILPDRGDRYVDTVYASSPGTASTPVRVAYGTEVSSWSYAVLDRPVLLFVESNTTGTGMLALRTAAWLGLAPVFLTSKPDRYAGLADTGARVVECDTNDLTAVREAIAELRPRGVATTSEFYLTPVAELARGLGLPGNPPDAIATCRDKSRTRTVLQAAGVRQPRFAIVDRVSEVDGLDLGFPCVAKPAEDSGSTNVLLCSTVDDLRTHVERVLAVTTNVRDQPAVRRVLVEEYLDDPEYSVELFSVAGDVVCVGVTEKQVTGLPYFVECGHVFPAEVPGEVVATAIAAVRATGFAYGASHVEVKRTAHGTAIVEINARLAGGMIPELVRLATGVDLLEAQVRAFAGLPVTLDVTPRRFAGIRFLLADTDGELLGVSGVAEVSRRPGVDRVVVTGTPGDRVRPPRHAYDRLGYVIAVGGTAGAVRDTLDRAVAGLTVEIREDPS